MLVDELKKEGVKNLKNFASTADDTLAEILETTPDKIEEYKKKAYELIEQGGSISDESS